MSTWGVLKFFFLYVFLMKINSSEAGCPETVEAWNTSLPDLFQVKKRNDGKVDVKHLLNRLCCEEHKHKRNDDDFSTCNLLRTCFEEDCDNSSLADADMNTNRFYVSGSTLRVMIAEEKDVEDKLFQCTAVTSMTSRSTPASTVPQTTPSLTTATATQVAKHTTSTQPITTRPTSTTTETVTSISTSTDIQTGDTDKPDGLQKLHNVEDNTSTSTDIQTGDTIHNVEDNTSTSTDIQTGDTNNTSTRPVLVLSICLCLSLILNAVLVLRPRIQSYARRRDHHPVEDAGDTGTTIQIDGDDLNDTDDDDNISL